MFTRLPIVVVVLALMAVAGSNAGAQETAPSPADLPQATEPAAPPSSEAPALEGPAAEAQAPEAPVALPGMDVAPDAAPAEAEPANALLPHDLSPWGMFMQADIVVKAVMVGLAFASVITWTIFLAKLLELSVARRAAARGLKGLLASRSLSESGENAGFLRGDVAGFVRAAIGEMRMSQNGGSEAGIKERVAIRLERMEIAAGRRMMRGTGLLATIGSTAPFVGLFGTVWGIMNSFIGISQAQTTNLAVVAPGIAEALLATAIGLVAAIPAVVIYNVFARAIGGYRQLLADSGAEIRRLVSRELDFGQMPRRARAAE
ncbi:tonB-system energizer ExbB [Methylobrevis pamukkalensis]|uniref:Biopolymer transport protein ExbB n=1 Tax=Methylobrevis pamukkalensis TaxID=1439726 RepID=A0A1E3H3W2_9HYPH|nr:tonB-system energizer ExbB [Methylobrevis pamukkalensis]ODN70835.1 Biopolymer transport protein ExbB [Methylobrevis pamukkalensis]